MEKKYFNAGDYQEEYENELLKVRIKYAIEKADDVTDKLPSEEDYVQQHFAHILDKEFDDKIKEHPYIDTKTPFHSPDTTFLIDKKYSTDLVDSVALDEFKKHAFDEYTEQYFGKLLFELENKFGDETNYSISDATNKVEKELEKLNDSKTL